MREHTLESESGLHLTPERIAHVYTQHSRDNTASVQVIVTEEFTVPLLRRNVDTVTARALTAAVRGWASAPTRDLNIIAWLETARLA